MVLERWELSIWGSWRKTPVQKAFKEGVDTWCPQEVGQYENICYSPGHCYISWGGKKIWSPWMSLTHETEQFVSQAGKLDPLQLYEFSDTPGKGSLLTCELLPTNTQKLRKWEPVLKHITLRATTAVLSALEKLFTKPGIPRTRTFSAQVPGHLVHLDSSQHPD